MPAVGLPEEVGPGLAAGKLWVTALVGDFAIRPLGPGKEEPAAPHPPLHHHFGYSAGTRFGVPTDFQEGRVPLSDPQLGWPPVFVAVTLLP